MKNYYKALNIRDYATIEEIKKAYFDLTKNADTTDKMDYYLEAYNVLNNNKEKYDKKLKKYYDQLENGKNGKKIAIYVTAGILAGSVALYSAYQLGSKNSKNTSSDSNNDFNSDSKIETEVNNEIKLNAENFEATVDNIYNDANNKGLNIDKSAIKSALFITNIDYLSEDDIKTLYGNTDLNMIEEIQNAYNYFSEVRTHNNNGGNYISFTNLVFDEEDKTIMDALDNEFIALKNNMSNMTSDEYQTSFNKITAFFTGQGQLVGSDGQIYSNNSFTSGAGLLSEAYWPEFAVTYSSSSLETKENAIDIKTLSENEINGSRYLSEIIKHESLNCLADNSNTLTK